MKIIYDAINKLSNDTWTGGPIKYNTNYPAWARHWIDCAKQIRDDFANQGLHKTALETSAIIDQQQKYIDAMKIGRNGKPVLSVKI